MFSCSKKMMALVGGSHSTLRRMILIVDNCYFKNIKPGVTRNLEIMKRHNGGNCVRGVAKNDLKRKISTKTIPRLHLEIKFPSTRLPCTIAKTLIDQVLIDSLTNCSFKCMVSDRWCLKVGGACWYYSLTSFGIPRNWYQINKSLPCNQLNFSNAQKTYRSSHILQLKHRMYWAG